MSLEFTAPTPHQKKAEDLWRSAVAAALSSGQNIADAIYSGDEVVIAFNGRFEIPLSPDVVYAGHSVFIEAKRRTVEDLRGLEIVVFENNDWEYGVIKDYSYSAPSQPVEMVCILLDSIVLEEGQEPECNWHNATTVFVARRSPKPSTPE